MTRMRVLAAAAAVAAGLSACAGGDAIPDDAVPGGVEPEVESPLPGPELGPSPGAPEGY